MTVFRGYLLIIRRNINMILMYILIFSGTAAAIQYTYQGTGFSEGFSDIQLKTAVIDRDGGFVGPFLKDVLGQTQKLVELPDEKHAIQEELYYSNVEYVVIVPEEAEEKLMQGEPAVETISIPGAVNAFYLEAQVNQILNQLRVYVKSGFSAEEACRSILALDELPSGVTLHDINGNAGIRKNYNFFFTYMPYAFFGASIMTIGILIMEFKKKGIIQRLQSSPVPFWKQNMAMAASFLSVGGIILGICLFLQTILYKGGIFTDAHAGLYLLNSFLCLLAALSLGFFTGTISTGPVALNALNNILTLGLCFLGGIFVPLEMMGSVVKKAALFLPTYWYSLINRMLGDHHVLSPEMLAAIRQGFLIQLLFSAACFGITLMIRRAGTTPQDN